MNTNKYILIGLLFLLIATDSPSLTKKESRGNKTDYTLVFHDEFNQRNGSLPDQAKWASCRRYTAQWNRWISDSRDVAFIKDGHLICRAIPNQNHSTDTAAMLTGAIETRGKFAFQYGKIEVRMRTNLQQGNFPAAWLVPTYEGGDKRYGEIDIVEMFGNQSYACHSVHTHRSYTLKKKDIPTSFKQKVSVTQWHVYGVIWTKDRIVWTIDGDKVGEYPRLNTRQMVDEGQWTFDRPFYIRLNQSVGDGRHPLLTPNLKVTYETQFDWVRVYKQVSE